ncbi:hypothetical protein [Acinetobacter nosocomialis]|uniref:hypothetical protein n=1 Tax=Acinetobacter nosocomialis TaxID=106654 RepID=UPI00300ADF7D
MLWRKEPAMSEFKAKDIVAMNVLTLPEPVGSLQELHPEFAKVLHENFLELLGDESNTVQMAKDAVEHGHGFAMVSIEGVEHVSLAQVINPFPCEELGDDFPIENHISPNCKTIEEQS